MISAGRFDLERDGAVRGAFLASSVLHPGDFLNARWSVDHAKVFAVNADAKEAQGGALAGMAGLRTDLPFLLAVRAGGSLSGGHISINTRVGPTTPLVANSSWNVNGGAAHGVAELADSRLLTRYQKMVGPVVQFEISGRKAPDRLFDLLAVSADNLALDVPSERPMSAASSPVRAD